MKKKFIFLTCGFKVRKFVREKIIHTGGALHILDI